jgi:large subunit ribosomal protein L31
MKQAIHPEYRRVVFRDKSGNFSLLTGSTRAGDETVVWTDGQSYPVVDVEISSASHPFYTGQQRVMDTQGRVEKFNKRYSKS